MHINDGKQYEKINPKSNFPSINLVLSEIFSSFTFFLKISSYILASNPYL